MPRVSARGACENQRVPLTSEYSAEEVDRYRVARAEARQLGYMLFVDETGRSEQTHAASAALVVSGQASIARYLCSQGSLGEAAERAVDILGGIVKNGEDWPANPPSDNVLSG